VVLTEGPRGGRIETASGVERFAAPPSPEASGGAYGAGDSFAGALVYFLALGLSLPDACAHAGEHGAAVLRGLDPLESQERILAPGSGPQAPAKGNAARNP
jgi:ribokinase